MRQLLDSAAPDLRGKQASEQPSHAFVCCREQTVDRSVLARHRTTRLLSANGAFTGVDPSNMNSNHMNSPP
jgi:hypothetical protein